MHQRYIYGFDLAETVDFCSIVVHKLLEANPIPKLVTLRKFQKMQYPDIMLTAERELFPRFYPSLIVTDYTSEKTFTEILERKGHHVKGYKFTQDSKLKLKQQGLRILQEGYKFPDPKQVEHPLIATWITELMGQLRHEGVILGKKLSFEHPQGDHNDLAIGWELSIDGCFELRQRVYSYTFRSLSKGR